MAKFRVGEVVILKSIEFPQYNGMEMQILEIEPAEFFINEDDGEGYKTDFHPNDWYWCVDALRRKYDDEEDPSWETIESITKWNPNKVVA